MNRLLFIISIITFLFSFALKADAQTNQIVANCSATAPVNFTDSECTYKWVNNTPSIGLPTSGTGNIASFTAVNTGSSPVIATITATPVSTEYAYITNNKSKSISVISTTTNMVASTISGVSSPWDVSALNVRLSKNYIHILCITIMHIRY